MRAKLPGCRHPDVAARRGAGRRRRSGPAASALVTLQSLKGQGLGGPESRVSPVWPRNPLMRSAPLDAVQLVPHRGGSGRGVGGEGISARGVEVVPDHDDRGVQVAVRGGDQAAKSASDMARRVPGRSRWPRIR